MDPVEREAVEALDKEVRPGVPYPRDPGRPARAREGRGALEPVPAGRSLRPRAHQLGVRDALRADGPQRRRADGLQLLGARHRQHGDPRRARHGRAAGALAPAAAGRRDPLLLLDDRAGDRGLRPDGPDVARGARRRRVGHQRPQVVHLGLQRRGARDRHGRDRPRCATAQARQHDPGAGGHARLRGRPAGAGDGPRRGAGPLGGPLRGLPRAGREPARRARRRLRDRAGPARSRSHPPLHARDRLGGARLRADVPAGARPPAPSARRSRRSSSSRTSSRSRGWRSTRHG